MGVRTQATWAFSMGTALFLGGAIALARDEARSERVKGDDDPIIVLRSVASTELAIHFLDPETTGSVSKETKGPQTCDRVAFFPERPAEEQLQAIC
jgi:hypothetical protein